MDNLEKMIFTRIDKGNAELSAKIDKAEENILHQISLLMQQLKPANISEDVGQSMVRFKPKIYWIQSLTSQYINRYCLVL